ncbi:alkaline phosphatase family protein [Acidipila sp. EB88]|nr:alkaline phosphatase family protein [Acidipila sp. EB88]
MPANDGKAAHAGPIVVLITIDGFPARALADPRLPMPTLRMLEAQGAHAEAMQPINPTVTWPNHTALITGVNAATHHVMANGLIRFPADGTAPVVEPWVPKAELVHAETLYEALAKQGMTTGQVDWVAIYGAAGVQWQFGEKPEPDGPIAKELIAAHLVTREQIAGFSEDSSAAWRDQVWTEAAVDILTRHTPNLLLLHLLETDSLQHEYGPLTPAAFAAYAYADACIRRVVDAAREAGVLDRTTFVLASDHGFASYTHTLRPNAVLLQQGLLQNEHGTVHGNVWVKAEGGAAEVFIRDPAQKASLLPRLRSAFSAVPGIEAVYSNAEAQQIGIPLLAATDQAPDLYLAARPDYAFGDDAALPVEQDGAPRGQHGYLNTDPDMNALLILSGAQVRAGVNLGRITNLQVAPTLAQILGVALPAAKAAPLGQALKTGGR